MVAFSMASFVFTSTLLLVMGLRLLWVARRTRMVPELSIGLAYSLGTVGLAALVAASQMTLGGGNGYPIWIIGMATLMAAAAALIVGVWRIFQPSAGWAAALAGAGLLLCVVAVFAQLRPGVQPTYDGMDLGSGLARAAALFSYAWVAVESFRYSAQLRRRRAVGLADSLGVQRFLLWGVSGTLVGIVTCIAVYTQAVLHLGLAHVPEAFLVSQVLLIGSSLGTWFAFFPPGFYQRWAMAGDELEAAA